MAEPRSTVLLFPALCFFVSGVYPLSERGCSESAALLKTVTVPFFGEARPLPNQGEHGSFFFGTSVDLLYLFLSPNIPGRGLFSDSWSTLSSSVHVCLPLVPR